MNRREFLSFATAGVAAYSLSPLSADIPQKIKAIAFDAFPIFDPRPIFALAEQLFPEKGSELSNVWRARQFEYQWLRALSGQYADFWQVTEDSLMFAAESLNLDLTEEKRKQLMEAYLQLKTWPDVPNALESIKSEGVQIAFLSNATRMILDAGIKNSSLQKFFDHVITTDDIKTYKPDPRAYRMAIDRFELTKEEILFVAFAGWDTAGAKSFGYTTFWVNRLGLPAERLGFSPDGVGKSLEDLVDFIKAK